MRYAIRYFLRHEEALSSYIEGFIVVLILLVLMGGFFTYLYAFHSRTILIQAAFAAARTASLQCDPSSPAYNANWSVPATSAAAAEMQDGGLILWPNASQETPGLPGSSGHPGDWNVGFQESSSCAGGTVTATVNYNTLDLFPPVGGLLYGASATGLSLFTTASAVVPVETGL